MAKRTCSGAWSIVAALAALMPVTAVAEPTCIISTYAIKPGDTLYIDIRPFASDHDRLPAQVLQITLPQLLASRALQGRPIALIDNPRSDNGKHDACRQLIDAGYTDVAFIREDATDLKWSQSRLVLKNLPAHGWQVLPAADMHQMLSEVTFRPVHLAINTPDQPTPVGFERADTVEQLLSLVESIDAPHLVIFPPDSRLMPIDLGTHKRRNLWWVADGIEGFQAHQRNTLLAALDRNNRFRLCER